MLYEFGEFCVPIRGCELVGKEGILVEILRRKTAKQLTVHKSSSVSLLDDSPGVRHRSIVLSGNGRNFICLDGFDQHRRKDSRIRLTVKVRASSWKDCWSSVKLKQGPNVSALTSDANARFEVDACRRVARETLLAAFRSISDCFGWSLKVLRSKNLSLA